MKTSKFAFEINWLLVHKSESKNSQYASEFFKPLTENFATKVGMKIMASKPIKTIGPAYMHTDHE